jgi:hypothetical protein
MALEMKDVQDWAARADGAGVSEEVPGVDMEVPEEEEIEGPVDPAALLAEITGMLADVLAKAGDAAQGFRDEGVDASADALEAAMEQIQAAVDALSEIESEEPIAEDEELSDTPPEDLDEAVE